MMIALNMVWNPIEGIDLGFIQLRFYSLMWLAAFALGFYLTKKIFIREQVSMEKLDALFIYTLLATMLGARLGHVFFYDWDYYRNHLLEILLPFRLSPTFKFTGFQGLASHGAAIGVIIAMYYYVKKVHQVHILWVLDRITIPVSFGGILIRLGNFFNSEINGKITEDATFGVKFIRSFYSKSEAVQKTGIRKVNDAYTAIAEDPKFAELLEAVPYRHPAQLYEAFGYIFVGIIVWLIYWKTDKRKQPGFLFGVFLILLWGVRFVVEYVKASQDGFGDTANSVLSTGQWLSIPFMLAGVGIIIYSLRKQPQES